MRIPFYRFLIPVAGLLLPALLVAQDKVMTIEDVLALNAVGNPQVSPDGEWVAYTVRSRDMDEDESRTRIWIPPTSPWWTQCAS